ncbi:hypothetical protein ACOMHN_012311 [Nucella lapillus]
MEDPLLDVKAEAEPLAGPPVTVSQDQYLSDQDEGSLLDMQTEVKTETEPLAGPPVSQYRYLLSQDEGSLLDMQTEVKTEAEPLARPPVSSDQCLLDQDEGSLLDMQTEVKIETEPLAGPLVSSGDQFMCDLDDLSQDMCTLHDHPHQAETSPHTMVSIKMVINPDTWRESTPPLGTKKKSTLRPHLRIKLKEEADTKPGIASSLSSPGHEAASHQDGGFNHQMDAEHFSESMPELETVDCSHDEGQSEEAVDTAPWKSECGGDEDVEPSGVFLVTKRSHTGDEDITASATARKRKRQQAPALSQEAAGCQSDVGSPVPGIINQYSREQWYNLPTVFPERTSVGIPKRVPSRAPVSIPRRAPSILKNSRPEPVRIAPAPQKCSSQSLPASQPPRSINVYVTVVPQRASDSVPSSSCNVAGTSSSSNKRVRASRAVRKRTHLHACPHCSAAFVQASSLDVHLKRCPRIHRRTSSQKASIVSGNIRNRSVTKSSLPCGEDMNHLTVSDQSLSLCGQNMSGQSSASSDKGDHDVINKKSIELPTHIPDGTSFHKPEEVTDSCKKLSASRFSEYVNVSDKESVKLPSPCVGETVEDRARDVTDKASSQSEEDIGSCKSPLPFDDRVSAIDTANKSSKTKNTKDNSDDEGCFTCVICSETFHTENDQKNHFIDHLLKPYWCEGCDEMYAEEKFLRSHELFHSGGRKPYSCDRCDKSYVFAAGLEDHRRRHVNDNPYACTSCSAAFHSASKLAQHMRQHTDHMLFCWECEKSMESEKALKEHNRRHLSGSKEKCGICSKTFLMSYMRLHRRKCKEKRRRPVTKHVGDIGGKSLVSKGTLQTATEIEKQKRRKNHINLLEMDDAAEEEQQPPEPQRGEDDQNLRHSSTEATPPLPSPPDPLLQASSTSSHHSQQRQGETVRIKQELLDPQDREEDSDKELSNCRVYFEPTTEKPTASQCNDKFDSEKEDHAKVLGGKNIKKENSLRGTGKALARSSTAVSSQNVSAPSAGIIQSLSSLSKSGKASGAGLASVGRQTVGSAPILSALPSVTRLPSAVTDTVTMSTATIPTAVSYGNVPLTSLNRVVPLQQVPRLLLPKPVSWYCVPSPPIAGMKLASPLGSTGVTGVKQSLTSPVSSVVSSSAVGRNVATPVSSVIVTPVSNVVGTPISNMVLAPFNNISGVTPFNNMIVTPVGSVMSLGGGVTPVGNFAPNITSPLGNVTPLGHVTPVGPPFGNATPVGTPPGNVTPVVMPLGNVTPLGNVSSVGTPLGNLTPVRNVIPFGSVTPARDVTPVSNITPASNVIPLGGITPVNNVAPVASVMPLGSVTPVRNITPVRNVTPISNITPASNVTSVSNIAATLRSKTKTAAATRVSSTPAQPYVSIAPATISIAPATISIAPAPTTHISTAGASRSIAAVVSKAPVISTNAVLVSSKKRVQKIAAKPDRSSSNVAVTSEASRKQAEAMAASSTERGLSSASPSVLKPRTTLLGKMAVPSGSADSSKVQISVSGITTSSQCVSSGSCITVASLPLKNVGIVNSTTKGNVPQYVICNMPPFTVGASSLPSTARKQPNSSSVPLRPKTSVISAQPEEEQKASLSVKKRRRRRCVPCDICGEDFKSRVGLRKHTLAEHGSQESGRTERQKLRGRSASCRDAWKCLTCDEVLTSWSALLAHRSSHQRQRVWACTKEFTSAAKLRRHEDLHSGIAAYPCSHCRKQFSCSESLKYHYTTAHVKAPPKICIECKKTFDTSEVLSKHTFKYAMSLTFHKKEHARRESSRKKLKPCKQSCEGKPASGPVERGCVCHMCGKVLANRFSLQTHELTHSDVKPFNCSKCQCGFNTRSQLQRHEVKHSEVKKPFSCDKCGKTFTSEMGVRNHIRTIHLNRRPFGCDVCKKRFSARNVLLAHKRIHSDERPYACEECGERFKHAGTLKCHKLLHDNLRPFKCDKCGKGYITASSLEKHVTTHSDPKCVCDVCGKAFYFTVQLNRHKEIHREDQPSICNVCNKSFLTLRSLQTHQLTHSSERAFQCDLCEKRFRSYSGWMKHKVTHSSVKPHVCDVCHKTFKRSDSLKVHRDTHFSEKKFVCDQCGLAYHGENSLRLHQKLKHLDSEKPFVCKVCSKAFQFRSYLKEHELVHSSKKTLVCKICNKAVKYHLERHMKLHHGSKPGD